MAIQIACANGNWSSTSSWQTADSTIVLRSEANNTNLTTSYVESAAGTPGAITIDGIIVFLASRAASPTGTISVRLAQGGSTVAGTEVTINVSDLPTATATSGTTSPVETSEGGPILFKFAAPVTLAGATAYTVSAKTSSANQVNLWRDSTANNWSRLLRTTSNPGSVAAGDDFIIRGEWTGAGSVTARTITADTTAATDFGSNSTSQYTPALAIGDHGTLTAAISASTTYILQLSGYAIVYNGGTLTLGASGSEMPRTSTFTLQFDCGSDGDFGLVCRIGSTFITAGLSRTSGKNVTWCHLNADAAGSATSITLDTDTGWLNGDSVCLAPTSRTSTQYETKALTGNATSTTAAISALSNAHSGTSPTQAEVGLMTRNVVIKGVTANVCTFVLVSTTTVANLSWTRFTYGGNNSTNKHGALTVLTTTGSFTMDRCCADQCDDAWLYITGGSVNNITVTNNVFYLAGVTANTNGLDIVSATTGTWTIDTNLFCGGSASNSLVRLLDIGGTFTNNAMAGCGTHGLIVGEGHATVGTFTNNISHSNQNSGFDITGGQAGLISGGRVWRNNTAGAIITGQFPDQILTLQSIDFFGNTSIHINCSGTYDLVLDSVTASGDTSFSTTNFFNVNNPISGRLRLFSCQTSQVAGIKTQMTNDFQITGWGSAMRIEADNCKFNSTNLYAGIDNVFMGRGAPFLTSQNHNQTVNDNRAYFAFGNSSTASIIKSNSSTVYSTNPLSEEMQPRTAAFKLESQSIKVPVISGKTITPTVQVQKDGSYNGNAPRLILKRQDSMGVTADTVLDTLAVSSGTWDPLTGTTGAAPQDGVFEFVVDCDGTAGSAFVGDVTAVAA